MHGSPCQDFSVCGLNKGGDEGTGTRSSLMWETVRIIAKLKPKYVIWENVKNVISKKHKHNFDKYINELDQLGYNSYYKILNAKDYGNIPQNRERVFTISIRKDIDKGSFVFPEKQELKLRLKDLLEDEVDEKYYLSDDQTKKIQFQLKDKNTLLIDNCQARREGKPREYNDISPTLSARDYKEPRCIQVGNLEGGKWDKINESCRRVYSEEGLSPTVHTCQGGNTEPKVLIKNNTKKGYLEAEDGDGIYTNITTKRGTVQKGMIPALTSLQDKGVIVNERN
jgi:DNA (cytosine-5)-methyltransferase 1